MYNALRFSKFIAIFISLIFIDQFSKYIIRTSGGFYICNKGIAFGINIYWGIIALTVVAIFFLLIRNHQKTRNKEQINFKHQLSIISNLPWHLKNWLLDIVCILSLGNCFFRISALLILAGAISNILDRLYFGCVIDFIGLHFWPVFNLADVCITIGCVMLLSTFLFKKVKLVNHI